MAATDAPRRQMAFADRLASLPASPAGVRVSEPDYGLCTLHARRDGRDALGDAVREVFGLELVSGPKVALGPGGGMIGVGPGAWLAFQEAAPNGWSRALAARLAGLASVNDQSGGYAVLRLAGPRVRELLAKGAFLDFHPSAFPPCSAAVTVIAHIGVTLRLQGDGETFEAVLFRSYAASFWRWLEGAGAEYGLAREPAQT